MNVGDVYPICRSRECGASLRFVDCRQLLAICNDRFDVCLRGERFCETLGRVHHLHDESCRKPHSTIWRHIHRSDSVLPPAALRRGRRRALFAAPPSGLAHHRCSSESRTLTMPHAVRSHQLFLFVLNEGVDRVAGQPILRRESLHFSLAQSDEPVVERCHDGTVCLDHQVIGDQIGSSTRRKFFL